MDARGNKLSSCKILENWTLWLKKEEKRKRRKNISEYNRVVTTLKRECTHVECGCVHIVP